MSRIRTFSRARRSSCGLRRVSGGGGAVPSCGVGGQRRRWNGHRQELPSISCPHHCSSFTLYLHLSLTPGDITQADVDMLQKSYRIMTGSMVAGLLSGIPVWFITGRRGMPPMLRLFASSATSLGGSFLATSVGGAVAAIEIKKNMPEWERLVVGYRPGTGRGLRWFWRRLEASSEASQPPHPPPTPEPLTPGK